MSEIRFYLTCIFLCAILTTGKGIAAPDSTRAFSLFARGEFFKASVEFERIVFYETDNNKIAWYRYVKALCYKEMNETDKALNELETINLFTSPDSLFINVKYEQALCNYLIGNIPQALWNFDEIHMRFPDTLQTINVLPLQILCLNADRQWTNALACWNYLLDHSAISEPDRSSIHKEIDLMYSRKDLPRYRKPERAENWSRFIPGSGQMYCGAVGEGSVNLLIHLSLLGFAGWEFYSHCWITGYFVGLGLFNKFYHGGMHRAYLLAMQKNSVQIRLFNEKNSGLLIKTFSANKTKTHPGLKP